MYCLNCGNIIEEDFKFCRHCGAESISEKYNTDVMIIKCPKCGAKNQTIHPLELGKKYRCGECQTLMTLWKMHHNEPIMLSDDKSPEFNEMIHDRQANHKTKAKGVSKPAINLSLSNMSKSIYIVLGIVLMIAIVYSIAITRDRNALITELNYVQSSLASTKGLLASTQSDLSTTKSNLTATQAELSLTKDLLGWTQADLDSTNRTLALTQADLDSTNQALASIQNEVAVTRAKLEAMEADFNLYKETLGTTVYSNVSPPYTGGGLQTLNFINSTDAVNPTWQELTAFLLADPTDDERYVVNQFICSDFAEMLHNNAEAAGIKSAFVAAHFKGEVIGHAVNAFRTTDRGLVYIDSGGKGAQSGTFLEIQSNESKYIEHDKISYLVKGKECGAISLGPDVLPQYEYYEEAKVGWNSYYQRLQAYNLEVDRYNLEIRGKIYYIGTLEWQRMTEWETNLQQQARALENIHAELPEVWQPLGIVESIEIYW